MASHAFGWYQRSDARYLEIGGPHPRGSLHSSVELSGGRASEPSPRAHVFAAVALDVRKGSAFPALAYRSLEATAPEILRRSLEAKSRDRKARLSAHQAAEPFQIVRPSGPHSR